MLILKRDYVEFVDLLENVCGFKCGINYYDPSIISGSKIATTDKSISVLSNSYIIRDFFIKY